MGDYCFMITSEQFTRDGAQSFCEQNGGSLAVISSQKQQDSLTGEGNYSHVKCTFIFLVRHKDGVHLRSESEINFEGIFKERVHLRGLYDSRESLTYKSQRKFSGACPLESRE